MSPGQIQSMVGGFVALGVGLWAIITRRISVGEDEFGAPNYWVYGWRAVLVGCAALVTSCVFFASAAGLIHFE
jgi:hypothetical protein